MAVEEKLPLVELVLEDERWTSATLAVVGERAARAALAQVGLDADAYEISLLATDDVRIAALNEAFRGKATPTNVLSWPAFGFEEAGQLPADEEVPIFLGDLAIAFETCAQEAEESGLTLSDHAAHLTVHGVFHLLGFDHEDGAEAERMEALEVKALASIGVADPYRR